MAVRILIDSTTDLPQEIKEQMIVVPLTIHFGEEEYLDGVTMNGQQFYERLVESDVLPTTSQVTPFVFGQIFEKYVSAGDELVVLTIFIQSFRHLSECLHCSFRLSRQGICH